MGAGLYFRALQGGIAIWKCSILLEWKPGCKFFSHNRIFVPTVHSAQLSHCCLFVSFLQKWNTQLIVPASSASAQNSAVGGKRSRVDSFGANRSFPVEQLQTFPQLLQNIHRLEVSGRKVSSSVLGKQKTFCLWPYRYLVRGQPNSERASSLEAGEQEAWRVIFLPVKDWTALMAREPVAIYKYEHKRTSLVLFIYLAPVFAVSFPDGLGANEPITASLHELQQRCLCLSEALLLDGTDSSAR